MKGHVQVLEKLTEQVDGQHRIIEEVPLIVRETHTVAGTPITSPSTSCSAPLATDVPLYLDNIGFVPLADKAMRRWH